MEENTDPRFEAFLEELFRDIVNQSPREKIRRLYRVLAWKVNAPVLDLDFGDEKYNSGLLLSCLTCLVNGKMLLFGPSGTGKSTLVECTAQLLFGDRVDTLQAATIHGHSQITMEDLEKAVLPADENTTDSSAMRRDISQVSILFIDDLSGMGEAAQTILNTLLEEGVIIRHNVRHTFEAKPVFATSNRLTTSDHRSRALLDRFHIATVPTGMNPDWLGSLIRGFSLERLPSRGFNIHAEDIRKVASEIRELKIAPGILERMEFFLAELANCERLSKDPRFTSKASAYLENESIVEALCHECELLRKNPRIICQAAPAPLSTRALEALMLYVRAAAWFLGRETLDDSNIVEQILPYVFMHRIIPSRKASESDPSVITRIPWIRALWRASQHTWDENSIAADMFRHVMMVLSDPDGDTGEKKNLAEECMDALSSMQTPARFSFMTALQSRAAEYSINIGFAGL